MCLNTPWQFLLFSSSPFMLYVRIISLLGTLFLCFFTWHVKNLILHNFLALPEANWNVSVGNITARQMTIHWQNLARVINQRVIHYTVLIRGVNSSVPESVIVSGNTTFASTPPLSPYTEYQIIVLGTNRGGQLYKSSNLTAWTDEGSTYKFVYTV